MEHNTTLIKLKALQETFANEFPFLKKHVGLEHFAKYFGISRQVLYEPQQKTNSKRSRVEKQIKTWNSKKFLKYLLSLKK